MSVTSVGAAELGEIGLGSTRLGRLIEAVRSYLPRGGSLPCKQWNKRHHVMNIALWLHVPGLFILGVLNDHGPLHVLLECTVVAGAATIARVGGRRQNIAMIANTIGLLSASAILVHFTGGLIEMHFHYFVIVAAVTLYQAWLPFLVAIAYVVAQHGIIGVLEPASVYNHPAAIANPWKWAVLHGLFIVGECVTLLIAWRLNEDSRHEAELSYQEKLEEEQARREVQDRYGRIFESAVEGIYETTVDGVIVTANPSLARILGYESVEEFISSTTVPDHYARPDDRIRFIQHLEKEDTITGFEFKARRRDGEEVWFSETARAVRDEEGNLVGIQGMLEDITGRKRAEKKERELEAQLRQAQKMEAFGQLAGGVAHDFNNLLSVIENYARFASQGLHQDDQRAQDMNEVLKASKRGADLVRQLLAFSRKDVVNPVVLNLNNVVLDLGKMLRRTLGEHIQLEMSLDPELWNVEVDPGHVEQILVNLAVNARDAMSGGGRLSIRTSNNHGNPSSDPAGATRFAMLVIEDNGQGMTPEVTARIFEPFFTTKDVGSGTGLGLATVYGIVRHWHGLIDVDSEPGRGTTFQICLPATEDAIEEDEAAGPVEEDLRGKETVLVVEDQTEVLEVVGRILRTNGYGVLRAASIDAASTLVELNASEIDLILADVVMPGGSGYDLKESLSSSHPNLKVVLMSGFSGDWVNGNNGAGNNGAGKVEVQLRKPFSSTELLRLVRSELDGSELIA